MVQGPRLAEKIMTCMCAVNAEYKKRAKLQQFNGKEVIVDLGPVSYTHLTLPTKRIV